MAKFGPYYGLCPLIDHRSLLGISKNEESGTVVVTLGKNIAIKHKLSDQKQLHSWRTKEKFTSPVIYDFDQSKYVAAFNNSYLRFWSGEEEQLDKVKKIKFDFQIHTLLSCNEHSFMIFRSGCIFPLGEAIDSRKNLNFTSIINEEKDTIIDVLDISFGRDIYIGLLIQSDKEKYLLWTIYNAELKTNKFFKISLGKGTLELNGYVFHKRRDCVLFLSLWSDGRMFSNVLLPDDTSVDKSGELFTAIDSISYKHWVSMVSLDENYIAMYGADCNEEGAVLIIYNSQFKVTQSRQQLKLFTNGAKLWCIEDNIILPVGQNLAVIPYYLATEQLAALVGSHKIVANEIDDDISIVQEFTNGDWGIEKEPKVPKLPEQIQHKVSELYKQGLPDNTIVEHIFTDIAEKQDMTSMLHILNVFSDISDKILVKFLKLVLNTKSDCFPNRSHDKYPNVPLKFQPSDRIHILNIILSKSFSGVLILPVIRTILDLDDVLAMVEYICFMFSEETHCLPGLDELQTEERLIAWASALLDASFQKLLLTKDKQCLFSLKQLRTVVKSELDASNCLSELYGLIKEFSKGKKIKKCGMGNAAYSIEVVNLY